MDRIAAAEERKSALSERLALERQSQAVEDWVAIWCRGSDRMAQSTFKDKRTWLDRLGMEVVVAKHGSDAPRYEISINLPVEIESVLTRDPNRELRVESEGETAYWTPPELRTPEQMRLAQEWLAQPDTPRRYPRSHSSRWGPCVIQGKVVIRWAALDRYCARPDGGSLA
jgi:hypothetical protein